MQTAHASPLASSLGHSQPAVNMLQVRAPVYYRVSFPGVRVPVQLCSEHVRGVAAVSLLVPDPSATGCAECALERELGAWETRAYPPEITHATGSRGAWRVRS